MQVIELPIESIKPYFKNAKDHSEKQIKKIAASIKEFGFNQPIVIDKDKTIIVGHGRYIAALSLGLPEVPVIMVNLDDQRAKSYRLADNKLNEHPTQKPVRLAERALKRSSEKGDIVIDAFGGSGSTMIACDQLERRARLIELDPKYADAIVGRWCKYKEDPKVIKNGKEIQWQV